MVSIQAAPLTAIPSPQVVLLPHMPGRIFEMTALLIRLGYVLRPTADSTGDGQEVDTC